jgi:cell division septal protein FtsQ
MAKPSGKAAANRRRRSWTAAALIRRTIIVAAITAVAVGVGYAAIVVSGDPRLALGDIEVTGAQRTGTTAVLAAADLPRGRDVWLLDVAGATRRIESLPWVESARVQRAWPNRVTVTVSERVAVARLALDAADQSSGYALLDADGRVLETGSQQAQDERLPLLVVQPLPPDAGTAGAVLAASAVGDALDALRQFGELGVRMTEIEVEPITGVSAITLSNVRVMFGRIDDLAAKLTLFDAIAKRISRPQDIAYVDVRSTSAPTVQYKR